MDADMDELMDLLAYECPYTGKKRIPGCYESVDQQSSTKKIKIGSTPDNYDKVDLQTSPDGYDETMFSEYFNRGLSGEPCEPPPAHACCKHVVQIAKHEVDNNPASSQAMREFACIREEDAEVGVRKVLVKWGFSAPVPISKCDLGETRNMKSFPWVKPSNWFAHLLRIGALARQMVGVSSLSKMKGVLTEFWRRYKTMDAGHPVFELERNGVLSLDRLVPFYSHSDEGRSFRDAALWVLNIHGVIGRGTLAYLREGHHRDPVSQNPQGLNYIGNTWSTHFLIATMSKSVATPEALSNLVSSFALDANPPLPCFQNLSSVDKKFEHLSSLYKNFFQARGKKPWVTELSRDLVCWPMSSTCPAAKWNKGMATVEIMRFIDWFAQNFLAAAAKAINIAVTFMYKSGLWLQSTSARRLSDWIFSFLGHYSLLAQLTLNAGKARYPMYPKNHMLCHAAVDLARRAERCEWQLSPLSTACQQEEDFIGKPSKISRFTNIRQAHRSVIWRSMIKIQYSLQQAGNDQRGMDSYADL
ncbi:unnamed protein product [Durusdinium trenchii]|uniref:Uncharacterized protein n=1 Tax=Durusdinium trenchii TaxID=1381693 RepID=A0ABP0JJ49_9DINO